MKPKNVHTKETALAELISIRKGYMSLRRYSDGDVYRYYDTIVKTLKVSIDIVKEIQ